MFWWLRQKHRQSQTHQSPLALQALRARWYIFLLSDQKGHLLHCPPLNIVCCALSSGQVPSMRTSYHPVVQHTFPPWKHHGLLDGSLVTLPCHSRKRLTSGHSLCVQRRKTMGTITWIQSQWPMTHSLFRFFHISIGSGPDCFGPEINTTISMGTHMRHGINQQKGLAWQYIIAKPASVWRCQFPSNCYKVLGFRTNLHACTQPPK